ncbi:MAG: hypothetical protein ACKV2T_37565 [Kofleriaceae bacterium]
MATKTLIAAVVLCAASGSAAAQPAQKITIGIYAPSVEFGTAQARLAYVQGLAKAIEQNTGIKTDAQSYASLGALKSDAVDFAIIDGQCYATNLSYKLLAAANIGGGTSRGWALYSNAGDLSALKGKKLAIMNTGCNDAGFVDNAMLESEVDPAHFGSRVGKPDISAAIAEVASYKTAQAVFAPSGSTKGLTKLFDTGSVPNPAFVDVGGKLPAATVDKVSSAVLGYGGGGAIASWQKGDTGNYRGLASRLGRVTKQGVLVAPELVRIDAKDVLSEPATLKDTAMADVRHHFLRSPGARME